MRVCTGRLGTLVLLGGLTGCVSPAARLPLPPEPVAVEPREGASLPVSRSYSEVLVRTYVEDAEGRRREVGGAECRLEVGEYGVRFGSPGRVLVPVPEVGAPVLGVACRSGALAGTARRAPARGWGDSYRFSRHYRPGRSSGWWGDPFWGMRSGVWLGDPFWIDRTWGYRTLPAGYPDVEVILR